MRPIRRILVGIKEPQAKALPAVEKAAQLARAFGAEIELFHALSAPHYLALDELDAQYLSQFEHAQRVQFENRLEAIAETLRERGIGATTYIASDFPPGEAIVRRATRMRADLVVAECHAREHRFASFLRLTDWDLLRYSPVPVLLVKSKHPYRRPCLLAAVDPTHAFSKPTRLDEEILRTGDSFRKALRGTLHAVHAYVPTPSDAKPSELLDPDATKILQVRAEQHARARLQPLMKKVKIRPGSRHLVGEHPINAIPRLARRLDSQIVVMGAISRSGLKRIFIGNTAERILDSLDCDVLVVKPPGFVGALSRTHRARAAKASRSRMLSA
jgi:universal stress protein E